MAQTKPGGRITRSPGWWPGQAGGGRAGAVSEPPARRAQVWHQPSSLSRARSASLWLEKMGRAAYSQALRPRLASLALGDANRGARTWPSPRLALERSPRHRPPESRAFLSFATSLGAVRVHRYRG